MHPQLSGEVARLRAQDIARQAAARHAHPVHPPSVRPAGFLLTTPPWVVVRTQRAASAVRHRVGLALIRVGMRITDPGHQVGGIVTNR